MEFEKLKEIIAEVLSVDQNEVTLETTFTDDLGADSLDVFQIIMGIEQEFELTVDTDEVEGIKTVGDAVELIKSAREKN
ncbi:MAG: acyl carrier protein [Lachnospiraceae bacterium]|jgi:acyl carrier protein|nr:acyl carrier protein [Lachnospiraceae bacterium]MCR5410509.1 acyl carrier protein [Lachnospiraceae bacterium]